MGSVERRARERNHTRELILGAARDLFIKDGFDAVTMRRIAERIEYTPAAIYAHFKDKVDLVTALCDSDFGLLREAMQEAEKLEDPVERLRAAGYGYVDFALANPHHYRFMFMSEWPDAHEIDATIESTITHGNPDHDAYAFLTMLVRACIEGERFDKGYQDVDAVTQACWGAAHGAVSLYLTHGNDPWVNFGDPSRVARMLIDAHIRGMLSSEHISPEARPRAASTKSTTSNTKLGIDDASRKSSTPNSVRGTKPAHATKARRAPKEGT